MNQQIQRLEKDIENFPKTQDEHDKFVEKMSISFLHLLPGDLSILILCLSVYSTWKKKRFEVSFHAFLLEQGKSSSECGECKQTVDWKHQ